MSLESQKREPKAGERSPEHQQRIRQRLSESFGRLVHGIQMPELVRIPRLGLIP